MKRFKSKIEQEAFELFGEMRQLTKEEQKERNETLKRISKPTGENFFDIMGKLESDKIINTGITFENLLKKE